MYVQENSKKKKKTSEALAIIAMILLITYIADASATHGNKKGFLPMSAAQRGMVFGATSIILFLLSFAIGFKEKSKITTVLLISGGALIGTSVLGSSAMAKGGLAGIQSSFTAIIVIGYVIMGLGIFRGTKKK
jgi:hypothetical protein